jgi:hypothetical protein
MSTTNQRRQFWSSVLITERAAQTTRMRMGDDPTGGAWTSPPSQLLWAAAAVLAGPTAVPAATAVSVGQTVTVPAKHAHARLLATRAGAARLRMGGWIGVGRFGI